MRQWCPSRHRPPALQPTNFSNSQELLAHPAGTVGPGSSYCVLRNDMVTEVALAINPTGVRTDFVSHMVREQEIRQHRQCRRHDNPRGAKQHPKTDRQLRRKTAPFRTPGRPMTVFAEEFLNRQTLRWKPRAVQTNCRIVCTVSAGTPVTRRPPQSPGPGRQTIQLLS